MLEEYNQHGGGRRRLESPAASRNEAPIREVLARVLPGGAGDVLEIAAGTGQHAVHFAAAFPEKVWWRTDIDDCCLSSVEAWRDLQEVENCKPARLLDVTSSEWRSGSDLGTGLPCHVHDE